MRDMQITSIDFFDKKKIALRIDKDIFITEEEGVTHIYYQKNNKFYVRVYCNLNHTIKDILSDDIFCESMIEYYLFDKKAEHITDILHWYAESEKDINKIVFSLNDILQCDYIG